MISKEDNLWLELTKIESTAKIRSLIFTDVKSGRKRFKVLADDNPNRFFDVLGGDESDAIRYNWAFEYSHNEYIEENELEYDENEANKWDMEAESIEKANDSGHWLVTGISTLDGLKGEQLFFELQYSEGYFDGIIGTPYNTNESGNEHGIPFD